MDKILKGIVDSVYPDNFKRALVDRTFIQAANRQQTTVSEIHEILILSLDLATKADKPIDQEIGCKVFKVWSEQNKFVLVSFFSAPFVLKLLSGDEYPNKKNVLLLLKHCLEILQDETDLNSVYREVQMSSATLLSENNSIIITDSLTSLLLSCRACVPQGKGAVMLAVAIVRTVATTKIPTETSQISLLNRSIVKICHLFRILLSRVDQAGMLTVLQAIYNEVSSSEMDPSIALGAIVQFIPISLAPQVTANMMSDTSVTDEGLQIVLRRMVDWLMWPAAANIISQWIINLLRGLASASKFSVLILVTQTKVEQVFDMLQYPKARKAALSVLSHMLLSYQHSPAAFHKIINKVPGTISVWQSNISKTKDQELLKEFINLIYTMMHHYTGFPELYYPVLEEIKSFQRPTQKQMTHLLSENKWISNQSDTLTNSTKFMAQSETGKTGLINLGNTCYMNSILQALYMTDEFRNSVLQATPVPGQNLLIKLQYLFAFLTHTQRAAFMPNEFSKISKPPWFENGCQQDCSEYLRYMLDTLLEQELKSSIRSSASSQRSIKSESETFASRLDAGEEVLAEEPNPPPANQLQSLIHQNFGGKMVTSYRCLVCGNISEHLENFIDLHLAFPQNSVIKSAKKDKTTNGVQATENEQPMITNADSSLANNEQSEVKVKHQLDDLVEYYLRPEKMEGDNKYFCEKCNSLQDAERSIRIIDSPRHLILTLLRFAYNSETHSRSKILTEVSYPLVLQLPVHSPPRSARHQTEWTGEIQSRQDGMTTVFDQFHLYAVIVHSGMSSESGHYYTYAKHSSCVQNQDEFDNIDSDDGEPNAISSSSDKWFNFNDSLVTYSSYEAFCNLIKKFPKDTAYLLMYHKLPVDHEEIGPYDMDPKLVVLRKEIKDAIVSDNTLYLQEKENEARFAAQRGSGIKRPSNFWKDYDDDNPPSSCGGGNKGFGGINSGFARFVY